MNLYDFADNFLQPYKIKGDEIIPQLCPICRGGESYDKHTFAVNIRNLTYNCMRGSCNAKGTFAQLCRINGVQADTNFDVRESKKDYKKPEPIETPPSEKAMQYMKLRGFTQQNIDLWKVKSDDQGNIVFPFYRDGVLTYVKYRKPYKVQKGELKTWQAPGCEPIFWGMDECIPELPLVITEGEFDAMCCTEAGVLNVVSIPCGVNNLECIDTCWGWLEQFRQVIVWGDNDEAGRKFTDEITNRIGKHRCSIVQCELKDANDVLHKEGLDKVRDYVRTAKEIPIKGVLRLEEVKPMDVENIEAIKSDHAGINKVLGGYRMGEVSLWTGINSSGKSTFLSQEYISTIDQGYKVCVFSGELRADHFQYWAELQMAGGMHIKGYRNPVKECESYKVPQDVKARIQGWYAGRFFLYDNTGSMKGQDILTVFQHVYQRYGVKRFMIDNLMQIDPEGADKDFYRKQSEFVGSVKAFAIRNNVHVDLVAHPRKVSGWLTMADIKGEGSIADRVDNIFSVHRIDSDDRKEIQYKDWDAVVEIFKNRFEGSKDVETCFLFDTRSKRFFTDNANKKYGWEL